jgi:hypothetical protein
MDSHGCPRIERSPEEILWSVLAFLMALSLGLTWGQMPADSRILSRFGMVACAGAALLMLAEDVPTYLARWRHAGSSGIRWARAGGGS